MDEKQFVLKPEHIDLLQAVNIRWHDAEYGGPAVDAKRPFGNSGRSTIEREICEAVGVDYDDEDARREAVDTYHELDTALQVVVSCRTFTPGVFVAEKYSNDWSRAGEDELDLDDGDECPVCGTKTVASDIVAVVHRADKTLWCRECKAEFS